LRRSEWAKPVPLDVNTGHLHLRWEQSRAVARLLPELATYWLRLNPAPHQRGAAQRERLKKIAAVLMATWADSVGAATIEAIESLSAAQGRSSELVPDSLGAQAVNLTHAWANAKLPNRDGVCGGRIANRSGGVGAE
jgi:hypothetical protein